MRVGPCAKLLNVVTWIMTTTLWGGCCYYSHFAGEQIEDQRPQVTCPGSRSSNGWGQERKESTPSPCLPSAFQLLPSEVPGLVARRWGLGYSGRAGFSEWDSMTDFSPAAALFGDNERRKWEKNGVALVFSPPSFAWLFTLRLLPGSSSLLGWGCSQGCQDVTTYIRNISGVLQETNWIKNDENWILAFTLPLTSCVTFGKSEPLWTWDSSSVGRRE